MGLMKCTICTREFKIWPGSTGKCGACVGIKKTCQRCHGEMQQGLTDGEPTGVWRCPTCDDPTDATRPVREVAPEHDPVNRPAHYTKGKFQPIEVIQDWKLGFCLGNTVKYIARAKHKGNELEDLKKAAFYLAWHIEQMEKGREAP